MLLLSFFLLAAEIIGPRPVDKYNAYWEKPPVDVVSLTATGTKDGKAQAEAFAKQLAEKHEFSKLDTFIKISNRYQITDRCTTNKLEWDGIFCIQDTEDSTKQYTAIVRGAKTQEAFKAFLVTLLDTYRNRKNIFPEAASVDASPGTPARSTLQTQTPQEGPPTEVRHLGSSASTTIAPVVEGSARPTGALHLAEVGKDKKTVEPGLSTPATIAANNSSGQNSSFESVPNTPPPAEGCLQALTTNTQKPGSTTPANPDLRAATAGQDQPGITADGTRTPEETLSKKPTPAPLVESDVRPTAVEQDQLEDTTNATGTPVAGASELDPAAPVQPDLQTSAETDAEPPRPWRFNPPIVVAGIVVCIAFVVRKWYEK